MKKWLLVLSLSALLAGLGYFWPEPSVVSPTQAVPSGVAVSPDNNAVAAKPDSEPQQITVTEKIPEPVTESFKLLASAYAAELELPAYSRPLSADDEHLLNPNRYIPQSVPLEGGASATIVLAKYRFSYPEPVAVTLEINGLQIFDVSVQLADENSADSVATAEMRGTPERYNAVLEPESDWNGAFEVQVSFSANGTAQVLKTGIEYHNPVATIVGVADSLGVGADMQIPVKLEVKQVGYYRIRANLYTAQRQPLALLTATEKLGSGKQEITLRAYKAVLRNNSGPYILGSFILEKRPAVPGEQTQYGDSEQAEYPLDSFSLNQLSDEPWQPDEQELQRLQFLQQMAEQQ
ncbi:MAG: hypothetical protein KKE30_00330 [Gammaproteobacteria bacterium]|nr:hypothetical protein [Gammaproteobacteria bacterium]MBU1555018.1 hypothetical protein [Gammaproteobacteria bacterium]MBU2071013.1 hypothetical protein [Gammaproteobacteria bacterium]MBU2184281.1 hypothetical protein [Gammaproteobacteria bacterium]MBU2206462.1 hypothetical protein [Gammaproteobacteria bacterium]